MTGLEGSAPKVPAESTLNYWKADPYLTRWLNSRMAASSRAFLEPRLLVLGRLAVEYVAPRAAIADRESPQLENGRISYHHSYREMEEVAYGSGMIAFKYDDRMRREHGGATQKIGFALAYVFAQAESGLFCPVCMTDGVARVLAASGDSALADTWIQRLCFTKAADRTTGAMFLTEKQGGSDVGASAVRAELTEDGTWRLWGEKWFCSNADAELALVLARPDDAPRGTRGLGLFLLPRTLPEASAPQPQMHIRKLKDKLGVRSMPTAEIELRGAVAWPIGPIDRGFKQMAEMVNYSRLYNAIAGTGLMARACHEAEVWANERQAFGRPIREHALVRDTLAALRAEHAAALALTFEAVDALDRADGRGDDDAEARRLFRALTPLAKYHTAKAAVAVCSEAMEVIGGNAYIEDRVMPRLLRDAQVLPIWEGTSNMQIHDFQRSLLAENAGPALVERVNRATAAATPELRKRLAPRVDALPADLAAVASNREPDGNTRRRVDVIVRTVEAALLAELQWNDEAMAILEDKTIIR